MDKKDTIVTDIVIQALKMDDTIKRQEVIIEQLRSDNAELLFIISKLKTVLLTYNPGSAKAFELINL